MPKFTPDELREVLQNSSPLAKQIAAVINEAAAEYVSTIDVFFEIVGIKSNLLSRWVVQPVASMAIRGIGPISREEWIDLYDEIVSIQKIVEENEDIREVYGKDYIPAHPGEDNLPDFDDIISGIDLEVPRDLWTRSTRKHSDRKP